MASEIEDSDALMKNLNHKRISKLKTSIKRLISCNYLRGTERLVYP